MFDTRQTIRMRRTNIIEPLSNSNNQPWYMVSYDPGHHYKGFSFKYYSNLQVYSNRPERVSSLTVPPGAPTSHIPSQIHDNTRLRQQVSGIRYDNTSVEQLVQKLTQLYEDNLPKADIVKILYTWIISLNIKETSYRLTQDFDSVHYQLQKLHDGKNSYASFFSLLCSYANIPCVIVLGHVKSADYELDKDMSDRFTREWNVVFVDNEWRLVDCYWGRALCTDPDNGFVTTDNFFLFTNPEHAKYLHFPENPIWQLSETPISRDQFLQQPILKPRFFSMNLELENQYKGVIKCKGKAIEFVFRIKSDITRNTSFVCAVSLRDPGTRQWEFLEQSRNTEILFKCAERGRNMDGMDFRSLPSLDLGQRDLTERTFSNQSTVSGGTSRPGTSAENQSSVPDYSKMAIYLWLKVKFPETGYYRVEIIGRPDITLYYDWVAIYNVDVKIPLEERINYIEILQKAMEAGNIANLREAINIANSARYIRDVRLKLADAESRLNLLIRNQAAMERIKDIDKHRIARLKSYASPNDRVVTAMRALFIVLGKPRNQLGTWADIKVNLSNDTIVQMENFDYSKVSKTTVQKARAELGSEDINDFIQQAEDVAAFVQWMKVVFDNVMTEDTEKE